MFISQHKCSYVLAIPQARSFLWVCANGSPLLGSLVPAVGSFSMGPISTPPPHCWHFGSRWQQPQLVVCPSTPVFSHSKKKDTQRKRRRKENRQHSALTDKQHLRNRKQIIHKNQRPSKSRKLQHTKKSKERYIWKQCMQIACKKRQRYQSDTMKQ